MMTSAGVSTPTPLHPMDGGKTTGKQQGGPQTSVTKQLHGMLEEMMEEVFVEGEMAKGKVAKALDMDMDGEFTIPAMPSPTRKEKNETETEKVKVVLELGAMSPLLREMREIEGVKCDVDVEAGVAGAVEIGPQEVKKEGGEEA